jgi:hypothetical protein
MGPPPCPFVRYAMARSAVVMRGVSRVIMCVLLSWSTISGSLHGCCLHGLDVEIDVDLFVRAVEVPLRSSFVPPTPLVTPSRVVDQTTNVGRIVPPVG